MAVEKSREVPSGPLSCIRRVGRERSLSQHPSQDVTLPLVPYLETELFSLRVSLRACCGLQRALPLFRPLSDSQRVWGRAEGSGHIEKAWG